MYFYNIKENKEIERKIFLFVNLRKKKYLKIEFLIKNEKI